MEGHRSNLLAASSSIEIRCHFHVFVWHLPIKDGY